MTKFAIEMNDVLVAIRGFTHVNSDLAVDLRELTDLIVRGVPVLSRSTMIGHITCGAILVRRDGCVMLVHHRILDRWLFPGGHVEALDRSLSAAALRELEEETGISENTIVRPEARSDAPIMIARHVIPGNCARNEGDHVHWDFRFLFFCDEGAVATASAESYACEWRNPEDHSSDAALVVRRWLREKTS